MAAIETDDGVTFRVDLEALGQTGLLGGLFGKSTRPVDPHMVALAVCGVMQRCQTLSANRRRLLWNEYRLFLCAADYERLRPLEARLGRDIGPVLLAEVGRCKAEVVGDLSLRLCVDEDGQLQPGRAVVRPAFVELSRDLIVVPGEMTVRIGAAPAGVFPASPRPEATVRVGAEAPAGGGGVVSWPGGSAVLTLGARVTVGRPHEAPPDRFVPLAGASAKISKLHAWIEVAEKELRVGRFSTSNPVAVNGRLVQPGGEIAVDGASATIELSNGELHLELRRGG